MKATKRDAIIDDLLLKRPSGPKGVQLTYTVNKEYCYDRGRYHNFQSCDVEHHGYDIETLFGLRMHDLSQVSRYVRERWFPGKSNWEIGRQKSTITRRANRIWNRISPAIREMKQKGGRGIYAVRPRYGGETVAYIFGNSSKEAISLAETFLPRTASRDAGVSSYRADFKEIGGVDILRSYNEKIQARLKDEVVRCDVRINEINKKKDECQNRMTMLNVLAGHQVAIETEV